MLDPYYIEALGVFMGGVVGVIVNQWRTNRILDAHNDKQEILTTKVEEVHREVRNDHPVTSNLRDDIDQITLLVSRTLAIANATNVAVCQVASDLADERRRSIHYDEYLNSRLEQFSGASPATPQTPTQPFGYGYPPTLPGA